MSWVIVKTTPCPVCSATGKVKSRFANLAPEEQVTMSCFDCKGRGTLFALDAARPAREVEMVAGDPRSIVYVPIEEG